MGNQSTPDAQCWTQRVHLLTLLIDLFDLRRQNPGIIIRHQGVQGQHKDTRTIRFDQQMFQAYDSKENKDKHLKKKNHTSKNLAANNENERAFEHPMKKQDVPSRHQDTRKTRQSQQDQINSKTSPGPI